MMSRGRDRSAASRLRTTTKPTTDSKVQSINLEFSKEEEEEKKKSIGGSSKRSKSTFNQGSHWSGDPKQKVVMNVASQETPRGMQAKECSLVYVLRDETLQNWTPRQNQSRQRTNANRSGVTLSTTTYMRGLYGRQRKNDRRYEILWMKFLKNERIMTCVSEQKGHFRKVKD